MSEQYTENHGNVAREATAHAQHKCGVCHTYLYIGERYVLFWDANRELWTLHKRCARKLKVVWKPIPKLKWTRVTKRRWRAAGPKALFQVIRHLSGQFHVVKNNSLVFDTCRDLITAQNRAEQEADENYFR